jgi:hypothetical protein
MQSDKKQILNRLATIEGHHAHPRPDHEKRQTDQIGPPASEGRGSQSARRRTLPGRYAVDRSDGKGKDAPRSGLPCESGTLRTTMRIGHEILLAGKPALVNEYPETGHVA